MRNLYDVYDREGNLVIEGMTSTEIAEALNFSANYVSKCACEEKYLGNKYRIVKVERKSDTNNTVKDMLLNKWDEAVKPFKKVMWVKELVPGVKKLTV